MNKIPPVGRWSLRVKRTLDLLLCLVLVIPVVPIMLAVVCLVKRDGGPVFFRSRRAGRNRQIFDALKFRSMIVDADQYLDSEGRPTRDRVTWVGKYLRRFSIDELPQIINVAKGEMSFVGPRPILPADAEQIESEFQLRFAMPPGITGLAQVSGRNTLPWIERYRLDVKYVTEYSLKMDFIILLKTISVVATGAGIVIDRNPDQVR